MNRHETSLRFSRLAFISPFAAVALLALTTYCSDDAEPAGAPGTSGSTADGSVGTGGSGAAGSSNGGSSGTAAGHAGTANTDSGSEAQPEASGGGGNGGAPDAGLDAFVDKTVRGKVKSPDDQAIAGATVLIGEEVAVTDAAGEFTISNAPATYDLLILADSESGSKLVEMFVGLTKRQIMATVGDARATTYSATVSGALSPGYPQSASRRTGIGFSSPGFAAGTLTLEGGQGPAFGPMTVGWSNRDELAGELYALQWTVGASGLPTSYQGWGTKTLALSAGKSFADQALTLNLVQTREVTGTVSVPHDLVILSVSAYVGEILLGDRFNPIMEATSVPYAYPVPRGITGVDTVLRFSEQSIAREDLSVYEAKLKESVSTLDVTIPAQCALALPTEGASGVDNNTEFAWTVVSGSVYSLKLSSTSGNGGNGVNVVVHTASLRAKIPDTSRFGIPLSGFFSWEVNADGPADATDDLVTGQTLLADHDVHFHTKCGPRNLSAGAPANP